MANVVPKLPLLISLNIVPVVGAERSYGQTGNGLEVAFRIVGPSIADGNGMLYLGALHDNSPDKPATAFGMSLR